MWGVGFGAKGVKGVRHRLHLPHIPAMTAQAELLRNLLKCVKSLQKRSGVRVLGF